MITLDEKFRALAADNAPGQEGRQVRSNLKNMMRGKKLSGVPVDFSHGDVDAFPPIPDSPEAWRNGFDKGGKQAYTEYRGAARIRERLAQRLGMFTGRPISADNELIITPGTQGALFLALGATVSTGTKVAVVEPDYFANRKLVQFFDGEMVPIRLHYQGHPSENGPDLNQIEDACKSGVKVFVFSTPNNPTGLVYSSHAIAEISALAATHDVTLIVDQLYSRMLYSGEIYSHLRACEKRPENLISVHPRK
jgi:aspartate/methionine/tyrosine aminotransferase